ncbi:MAG: polyamine aminopropyltransferase [Candidatus Aminicenantales bacterium]
MKTIEIREFHTPSSGIFFRARRRLVSERTPFQKMEVYETDSFGRVLLLDGLVQTTEKDEFFYHEMLVHPAMMSHPRPENVLIIGGGDGGALREVLRYPVKSAVLVEIDARVIEVCRKWFPGLAASFVDPRAEVAVEDGNCYIRETDRRFDVIVVDSSDPVGPSAILHQKTFFAALKTCLRPGGIIAAQAGSPLFHLDHLRGKRRFLKGRFKRALYYLGPAPTYPGGLWCYTFLSDRIDPLQTRRRRPPKKLKYYNPDIHRAAFALPEFLRER